MGSDKRNGHFVDYYELMQISSNAEVETIHRVFHMLASRYHPDNKQSGDVEKFLLLREAREILSQPDARAKYDLIREAQKLKPVSIFSLRDFAVGIDGESNRRLGVLCLLYNRRRTVLDNPGLSLLELETVMSFPREHLMFTLWYLGEKGHIRRDEHSNYMVTAEGVDYVESNLDSNKLMYRLLKAPESGDSMRDDARVIYSEGENGANSSDGDDSRDPVDRVQ